MVVTISNKKIAPIFFPGSHLDLYPRRPQRSSFHKSFAMKRGQNQQCGLKSNRVPWQMSKALLGILIIRGRVGRKLELIKFESFRNCRLTNIAYPQWSYVHRSLQMEAQTSIKAPILLGSALSFPPVFKQDFVENGLPKVGQRTSLLSCSHLRSVR